MRKKKVEVANMIGSRRILRDLKKEIQRLESGSDVAFRMRDNARNKAEFHYWDGIANERREIAESLKDFADQYRII